MDNSSPIWYPYTQHKTAANPIKLVSAKDEFVYTADGKQLLDAVSSWWVNTYGHGKQELADSIYKQILSLDHTIFAGYTHQPAIDLANGILDILPTEFTKVFFSDNGSTAVEVALKMAIQYQFNTKSKRKKIVALSGAYHGDTFGAMAAGERGKFFLPFEEYTFEVLRLPFPNEANAESSVQVFKAFAEQNDVACFIFEPLVQGAAGMLMYSETVLDELLAICNAHKIISIADEVMTGFGRTGKNFALEYLKHVPDIICISKGLTAGILPMSLTICKQFIFDAFYDTDIAKTLFHGHSYTGNPVGCAVALAGLRILNDEATQKAIQQLSARNISLVEKLNGAANLQRLESRGTIFAMEFRSSSKANYFDSIKERLTHYFYERGILVRPLGNVVYTIPPYCIGEEQLNHLQQALITCVDEFQ